MWVGQPLSVRHARRLFFTFGLHLSLNVKAEHFSLGIGAQRDGLAEVAGIASRPVVSHRQRTRFARQHRFLRIFGDGASARGDGLVDDKRRLADVGKRKRVLSNLISALACADA